MTSFQSNEEFFAAGRERFQRRRNGNLLRDLISRAERAVCRH